MIALYRDTLRQALKRAVKAWPVAFSLVLYAAVFAGAAVLVAPLGLLGGLLLGLVGAACLSGYLYFLSQAVNGTAAKLADLKSSFGAMFWDVISVMFALWLISLGTGLLARGAGPNAPALGAVIGLAMAFFFNAVPELIYQGRSRSFELLLDSGRFVMAHPFAWFVPNVILAALLLAPTGALAVHHPGELLLLFSAIFSPTGVARIFAQVPLWAVPLLLLLLHFAMVFRGVLFRELSSGSSRQRAWHERMH